MRYGHREGCRLEDGHEGTAKVMQVYRMACGRRKRQVDTGKIRKRKGRNVDIGKGT